MENMTGIAAAMDAIGKRILELEEAVRTERLFKEVAQSENDALRKRLNELEGEKANGEH